MRHIRRPIRGRATILAILPNGLHRSLLPNGYEVLAHLDRTLSGGATFSPGQVVELEFSAYDMTQARILGLAAETGSGS